MARKNGSVVVPGQEQLPVEPVDRPILCNPYEEPRDHWIYDKETGLVPRTRAASNHWTLGALVPPRNDIELP